MCDYSLACIPNRLAREGEDLVSHRFKTGTMGLASQADLEAKPRSDPAGPRTFWSVVKRILVPTESESVTAVCIPPGATLLLCDIPEALQKEAGVGRVERVMFTQVTAALNSYRDAVRFPNGWELLLQRLHEGQRLHVLALDPECQTEWGGEIEHQLSPHS